MSERDEHDQKIIRRFVSASNEVEARQILCQMWKESRFCDLMLVVDGSEYLAHRVVLGQKNFTRRTFLVGTVLSRCSCFQSKVPVSQARAKDEPQNEFLIIRRSIFREREKDFVVRTHLRRSSHKSLQIVLNFLYTGEITLTFRNINEVLSCARELGLEKIFEIGEEFLLNFDKRHVFRVLELSKRFGLKNSFRRSHVFLSSNFNQCVNMKQFLQLSMKTLVEILSDDTIRNRDESMLLGRILNWITTNHIDNNQVIVSLFEQIRWNQLDYQQKREWFTATQELADNAKLTSFIREQIRFFALSLVSRLFHLKADFS